MGNYEIAKKLYKDAILFLERKYAHIAVLG